MPDSEESHLDNPGAEHPSMEDPGTENFSVEENPPLEENAPAPPAEPEPETQTDTVDRIGFSFTDDAQLRAILEGIVYITDEPLSAQQIAAALVQPVDRIKRLLDELAAEYARPERGLSVREIAGGYKMATKPEHHETIRAFVKKLTPPLKLSLAALETLAVIAYKQPVTAPEIMDIRGVQGAGVLKTLLDRKLIAESGRKNVVGKPILYKTTKEFLVQFGLKNLNELPTLKEFEELGRLELVEESPVEASIAEASSGERPAPEPSTTAEDTGSAAGENA